MGNVVTSGKIDPKIIQFREVHLTPAMLKTLNGDTVTTIEVLENFGIHTAVELIDVSIHVTGGDAAYGELDGSSAYLIYTGGGGSGLTANFGQGLHTGTESVFSVPFAAYDAVREASINAGLSLYSDADLSASEGNMHVYLKIFYRVHELAS